MPITKKPTYYNEDPVTGKPIGDPIEQWVKDSYYWHYKTIKTWPETKTKIKQWFQNNFPEKPSLGQFLSSEKVEFSDSKIAIVKPISITWGEPCQTKEGWLVELPYWVMELYGDKILTETLKVASVDLLDHAEAIAIPKKDTSDVAAISINR